MQRFAAEHPDQATVTQGPSGYAIEVQGNHPELFPDMTPFFTVMQVGCALAVVLLAAAVTRRLHDRGRRGWWGLPPLPFLLVGMTAFPRFFNSTLAGEMTPDAMKLFGLLFANNCSIWVADPAGHPVDRAQARPKPKPLRSARVLSA
jgi:uncharacterized membrane protein YhaH (DUF805 family)